MRVVLGEGVERVHRRIGTAQGLGHEERISAAHVAARPLDERREIDVRRDEVDRRGARAPHVEQVRQRTGTRILAGLIAGTDQRGVDEHRQRVLGFACGGDVLRESREMPGHEDLLGRRRPRRRPRSTCRLASRPAHATHHATRARATRRAWPGTPSARPERQRQTAGCACCCGRARPGSCRFRSRPAPSRPCAPGRRSPSGASSAPQRRAPAPRQ